MEKGPKTTRVRTRAHAAAASLACQHSPLRRVVLEWNRVPAVALQRYTITLNEFLALSKMTMNELKLLVKLDEMVEMLEHVSLRLQSQWEIT